MIIDARAAREKAFYKNNSDTNVFLKYIQDMILNSCEDGECGVIICRNPLWPMNIYPTIAKLEELGYKVITRNNNTPEIEICIEW